MKSSFLLLSLVLWPLSAFAAGRTDWTSGNGAGAPGWTAAFATSDFTGAQPTTGQTVLSTVTIDNGTALDQFMDVSIVQSISTSNIAVRANISLWIVPLAADGTTYTPALTAGTASSNSLPGEPICVIPIFVSNSQTSMTGHCTGIIIPPGRFKLAEQNNTGWTYTSGTQVHNYRTYNIFLNN